MKIDHRHLSRVLVGLAVVAALGLTTSSLRATVAAQERALEEAVRRARADADRARGAAGVEVRRARRERDELRVRLEEIEDELWRERQRELVSVPQPPPRWRVPLRWGVMAAVPDEERLCPWVLPVHSSLDPSGSRLESRGGDTR